MTMRMFAGILFSFENMKDNTDIYKGTIKHFEKLLFNIKISEENFCFQPK